MVQFLRMVDLMGESGRSVKQINPLNLSLTSTAKGYELFKNQWIKLLTTCWSISRQHHIMDLFFWVGPDLSLDPLRQVEISRSDRFISLQRHHGHLLIRIVCDIGQRDQERHSFLYAISRADDHI